MRRMALGLGSLLAAGCGDESEHAIHVWDSREGTGHPIERSRIVNCARGIGIGLVDTVYGTRVLNNTVFSEHAGSREHDVGIIIERGVDMLVAHNTVFMSHPDASAPASSTGLVRRAT